MATSTLDKELPLVARTLISSQECIHSSSRTTSVL